MGTRLGDGVKYGEWYVRIDKDGDGVPELRYICTIGDEYEIVADEEANRIKFALFSCDPVAHTIVGDSLADYTEDIQRIKTNVMRAILDSAAECDQPEDGGQRADRHRRRRAQRRSRRRHPHPRRRRPGGVVHQHARSSVSR